MTEQKLTTILYQLHDMGITGIKVSYDGGGDSGAIDRISFTKEVCKTPEDVNDNIDVWEDESSLGTIFPEENGVYKAIEDFAYKILNDVEDWWNNEGGFGTFAFLVPSGKYVINNSVRIIETEDYFHDGDLFSRTLE
jgi:hypothetical protein